MNIIRVDRNTSNQPLLAEALEVPLDRAREISRTYLIMVRDKAANPGDCSLLSVTLSKRSLFLSVTEYHLGVILGSRCVVGL